jgi:hypothetical protein
MRSLVKVSTPLASKLATAGFQVGEVKMPAIFELHPAILRTIVRCEAASVIPI